MKKFLVLTNHSYMLWRFRRELIIELAKENEVVLGMPFVGHEDDFQGMGLRCVETKIDRRGINPFTDIQLLRAYKRLIAQEQPDMVLTYSIKPNIYAGIVCRWKRIPYCANVQGLGTAFQRKGLASFVTLLYRVALRSVRVVFFENDENAKEFLSRRIIPKEMAVVLNGAGVDLQEYPYRPYPNHDTIHFLYLGRIMREKGIDELFAVCERLHSEGINFVLDLVGFFEDEYKETVERMNREGFVKYHGFTQDPRPFYEDADCVVLPSYHEGMSNVLLEGAAIGRPLIASDIPGCREAVVDGESGLLCASRDTDSLHETMKRFAGLPREVRSAMGLAGRKHIETVFDKKKVVEETIRAGHLVDGLS